MRDLKNAAAIRKENVAVKSSKGERKALFHELLLDTEIDRDDLIDKMAVTLEERNEAKELSDDDFWKFRTSVAKSVSNFISKSYRESTKKATYNGDSDYNAEFVMTRKGNLLTITAVK